MKRIPLASIGRHVLGLLIALTAAAALALPSPKDIEAAVSTGQLQQAESLLREVIQAKPQSAKAQYELGQVLARQARYAEAQAALSQAQTLDPALKFAASPEKFKELFHTVSQQAKGLTGNAVASGLSASHSAAPQAPPAQAEPAFPMHYVWIGLAGVAVVLWLTRRQTTPAPSHIRPGPTVSQPGQPTAYAPGNAPGYAPGYAQGYAQGYAPPYPTGSATGGMGSGLGGAVVGGLAGVAAGYALSKALEGDHHSTAAAPLSAGDTGYVPFENTSSPDGGPFDAGSGSGWDDAPGDASSDDSW